MKRCAGPFLRSSIGGALLLAACGGSTVNRPPPNSAPPTPVIPLSQLTVSAPDETPAHGHRRPSFPLRDGKSGATLSHQQLGEKLLGARAIYVGEQHNSMHSHLAQLDVLAQTYAVSHDLALGVEMLPRRMQPQIDAFLAGSLDEAGFLAAVDWEHTWGFDYGLYRPLFEFCRTHGLRLFGLNAPREIVRAVGQRGVQGLTPEEKSQLPSGHPWPMPDAHRKLIRQVFDSHPGGKASSADRDAAFERFYTAQLIWDESMAQAVAEILGAKNPPHRLLVLAGVGHVGPYAIPGRAQRRGVNTSLTVGPVEKASDPPPQGAEAVDVIVVIGSDGESSESPHSAK